MKINNWFRKLSVTLVVGGLLTPCAAHAAGLDFQQLVLAILAASVEDAGATEARG